MQNAQPSGSSPANRQQQPNSHPARPPPPSLPQPATQLQHRPAVTHQNQQQHQQHQHQQQASSSSSSAGSTSATVVAAPAAAEAAAAATAAAKKRTHSGAPKRQKIRVKKPEGTEKKAQVSSCDSCKEGHRK
ncbi:hypothetical protein BGZ90_007567, partial [Linnemannia elongata]